MVIQNIENIKGRYYIRFMACDRPGVLAQISKILAGKLISIASVSQKEMNKEKFVPIVVIVHEAREKSIREAISEIDRLKVIKSPSQIIRIEDL